MDDGVRNGSDQPQLVIQQCQQSVKVVLMLVAAGGNQFVLGSRVSFEVVAVVGQEELQYGLRGLSL